MCTAKDHVCSDCHGLLQTCENGVRSWCSSSRIIWIVCMHRKGGFTRLVLISCGIQVCIDSVSRYTCLCRAQKGERPKWGSNSRRRVQYTSTRINQVCTKCQFLQSNYAMMCSAKCQGHLRIRHQSAADSCQKQFGPQTGQVQALFVTSSTLAVFAVCGFIEIIVTSHTLSLCV